MTKENSQKIKNEPSCKFCSKKFRSPFEVKRHEMIHTGERPFSCQYCDKRFIQKSQLLGHEKIHSRKEIFPCQSCNKEFFNKSDSKKHELQNCPKKPNQTNISNIHKELLENIQDESKTMEPKINHEKNLLKMVVEENSEYFVNKKSAQLRKSDCQYCHKLFESQSGKSRHKMIHTGRNPFSCKTCDKSLHQKVIGQEKLETCNEMISPLECEKMFWFGNEAKKRKTNHLVPGEASAKEASIGEDFAMQSQVIGK